MANHPYKARPVAATHEWLTPPAILKALRKFDLDPCAAPSPRPWNTAARHITLPTNGLTAEWSGRVWLNPPYGSDTRLWLRRMAQHGWGTAIVFARTDTRMFFESVWPCATALLFIEGRPKFYYPDGTEAAGNSGGPLVLVAYGDADAGILEHSGIAGRFVDLYSASQREAK